MKFLILILAILLAVTSCGHHHKGKHHNQMAPQAAAMNAPIPVPLSAEQVTAYTSTWPQNNQEVYNKLVSKYGQPHEATATHLTWYNNGPWKKTVLNKQAGNTMLEQTAYAEVPPEKLSEIALFNKGIQVDQTNNEITARSNREENNFLTLNLAKEIIDGNMSATEARRQAAQVKDVMSKSQYMKSLNFTQGPTPASNSSHQ